MKKIMFRIALAGVLVGACTLVQTIKHFGGWFLIPLSMVFVGSLCGNYLLHEWRKECAKNRKKRAGGCNATYTDSCRPHRKTESTQKAEVFALSEKAI